MKIATQLGILDDAPEANSETALTANDERILQELVQRRHGGKC